MAGLLEGIPVVELDLALAEPLAEGDSIGFHRSIRGKRLGTLDIKSAADFEKLKRIVRQADILIRNLWPKQEKWACRLTADTPHRTDEEHLSSCGKVNMAGTDACDVTYPPP